MKKYDISLFKKIAIINLYVILTVILISMILGTGHLISIVIQEILTPNPYVGLLNINDLFEIFSLLLIIVVGYELMKSITIIINSDIIPVSSILKIGGIAVTNKIITMDLKTTDYHLMLGMGGIIISLGVAYYYYNKLKDSENEHKS